MNAVALDIETEVDEALAYHGGDAKSTIAALLADRDFLAKELQYASLSMSMGFARGWQPSIPLAAHRKADAAA